jgi:phosphatidate cytidylyltransferase
VHLRADAAFGFAAVVFVFAVVWATDILAYFLGRAVGGPKLAPAISPKKTWSGSVGGTIAAIVAGLAVAPFVGLTPGRSLAVLALALSIVAQCGDLAKSKIKRTFGVKDSSALIPGHGGLIDRLDGFWAATLAAVLIVILRGGLHGSARDLVLW